MCLLICRALAASVSGQIRRLLSAMEAIAAGETEFPLTSLSGKGEVARMTASVAVFRDNAARVARLDRLLR